MSARFDHDHRFHSRLLKCVEDLVVEQVAELAIEAFTAAVLEAARLDAGGLRSAVLIQSWSARATDFGPLSERM